jgi:DNA repair protein RecO (recombination protein O)
VVDSGRSFRVEAVVLRHSNTGEADRILTLYSRNHGKIRVIARGVRKIKSRKAGHLEPFNRITVQLARGHDFDIVTQADTLVAYPNIRASLDLTGYTAVVIELLDRFTFEAEENAAIYRLLIETLDRFDHGEDPFLALSYFQVHFLDCLGYRPELFACANCRKEIKPEDQFFSPEHGGIICPNCGRSIPHCRPASMAALKYLRHLQRSAYPQARIANPDPVTRAEMDDLLQSYLSFILERSLNAPRFLRQIHQKME